MTKRICEKIVIDDVVYVPETNSVKAEKLEGMEYCIIRTYSAGVFAGYVARRDGKEALIKKARRLWSWQGAASLSQLAQEGTSTPKQCKFPCEVDEITVTEVIEVLSCTEKAKKSISEVPVWQH